MDENDFDQILHTDFHPNTAPPPSEVQHDHQQHDQHQEQQQEEPLEPSTLNIETPQEERDISHESDTYNFADDIARSRSIDRQTSLPNFGRNDENNNTDVRELSYEDKKARQRDQNRFAALKSRAKKRDRYALLEDQVEELQDENEKLRIRLAKLQAERPGSAPVAELDPILPSLTVEEAPRLPELDHQYFRKVVNNLESLKFTLLSKEMELERFRQGLTDSDTPVESLPELREKLIRNLGNLILVQAESGAINRITENLRLEKVNMAKERDTITREVDARMAVKQINGVGGEGPGGEVDNVEQALLEVRGWVDETIAKWENETPLNMGEVDEQVAA